MPRAYYSNSELIQLDPKNWIEIPSDKKWIFFLTIWEVHSCISTCHTLNCIVHFVHSMFINWFAWSTPSNYLQTYQIVLIPLTHLPLIELKFGYSNLKREMRQNWTVSCVVSKEFVLFISVVYEPTNSKKAHAWSFNATVHKFSTNYFPFDWIRSKLHELSTHHVHCTPYSEMQTVEF